LPQEKNVYNNLLRLISQCADEVFTPDNPEVDEPLKIEAKDSDPYVGADAAAAAATAVLLQQQSNFEKC
jgi:hypothetical protein